MCYRLSGGEIPDGYEVLLIPVPLMSIGRPRNTREYAVNCQRGTITPCSFVSNYSQNGVDVITSRTPARWDATGNVGCALAHREYNRTMNSEVPMGDSWATHQLTPQSHGRPAGQRLTHG